MSLFPDDDLIVEFGYGNGARAAVGLGADGLELRASVPLHVVPRELCDGTELGWERLCDKAASAVKAVRDELIPFVGVNVSVMRGAIKARRKKEADALNAKGRT